MRQLGIFKRLTVAMLCVPLILTTSVGQAAETKNSLTPLDLNLPSLGTSADTELTPIQEFHLGEQIMRQIRADASYLPDPEITEYLNQLGYQLVSHTSGNTYTFTFFAIRDPSLNAFSLPGGFIAMNTGTIIAAQNESELAGVLGHEIGHVTQRHIARMIEQQKGNLALTLGSILLALLAARAGGGQAAAAVAIGSQAAMLQNQLNFSQDAEREADRIGLQTLAASGFDPKGMEGFFERLENEMRFYQSAAPAYLSTHPLTIERMADMENRTRHLPAIKHTDSIDFKLIQVRAQVLQGTTLNDWRKTLAEFNRQLKTATGTEQCVLQYGISVAQGLLKNPTAAYNAAQQSLSCKVQSPILVRNALRTAFDHAKTNQEKLQIVQQAYQATNRFPLSSMIASNYADLLYATNQHKALINFLRNNTAFSSQSPTYHALLARSYAALHQRSLQYLHTGEMYYLQGNLEGAIYQYNLAQRTNDGDFYTMSEIDARLRDLKAQLEEIKKNK